MFIRNICFVGLLCARHFSRGQRPGSRQNGWIPLLGSFVFWLPPLSGVELLAVGVCQQHGNAVLVSINCQVVTAKSLLKRETSLSN